MSERIASSERRLSQAERRRASEKALIEAALEIAAEQGVASVTFEAIGARAGYSRGLATQHFGSKQGLIRAVIDHLHAVMDDRAQEAAARRGLSGLAAVRSYIDSYFRAFRSSAAYRSYFDFLAGAVADRSEALALFKESHDRAKNTLTMLIRRGQEEGAIAPALDPELAAVAIGALIMGLSVQFLIDPTLDLEQMGQVAQTIALAAIGAPDAFP